MKPETSELEAVEKSTGSDRPQNAASEEKPLGIGGVLVIVAIGLVISLIQNLGSCLSSLGPVLDSSIWGAVTDPYSPAYHPYWKPVLIYEAAIGPASLLLNAVMLWLFFRKNRLFPKLMIILIPVFFVLLLIGYYMSGFIPVVVESAEYAQQRGELIVKFVALHVWIPYFLLSKRVEKTFVR